MGNPPENLATNHRSGRIPTRGARARERARARAPLTAVGTVLVALLGVAGLVAFTAPSAAVTAPPQGWTTGEAPLPSDAATASPGPQVYVDSTSCPGQNVCVHVGYYNDAAQHAWGLIEMQNGSSLTDIQAPQPGNAGSGADQGFWFGSQLCGFSAPCRAVSCPTVSFCVAVGQYTDSAGHLQAVLDTYDNGTWTSQTAALPADAATDTTTDKPDNFSYSVSCASSTFCVAVGRYVNTAGALVGLVDTLSGTTWTATAAPLPAGVTATLSEFFGVGCASVTSCAVAGEYVDAGTGAGIGLLLVLANGTWTATSAPLPANAASGSGQHTQLFQDVCATPSSCVAVGVYAAGAPSKPLIETWNGSTWSGREGPVPADDEATAFDQLSAVSCGSPSSCVAVGTYQATSGRGFGLIDQLSDGTWSTAKAPEPANAATTGSPLVGQLNEVSCPSPVFCLTAGTYTATGNVDTAMVDTWSGGSWSSTVAPLPANAASGAQSLGRTASCYSPVSCSVAGTYTDPGFTQGYVDTWTGVQGYWLTASDGGVFTYGNGQFYGSTGNLRLNAPVVGVAPTPDGQGYWLVAADGGIFNYGDAAFEGSAGALHLVDPVVGMAPTPDGRGYWLVASDGGVFSYGDAQFYGSAAHLQLHGSAVGMAATPDGGGYWIVASDGGVFSYGDAQFYGSTGNLVLNRPVVGMAATPDGLGYWLVASDGGIFSYGDAVFHGSTGNLVLNKPVVGMVGTPSGLGYWLVASDGGVFSFGDALFYGSTGNIVLNKPMVGMAG
jgi:hypothetical protein